MDFAARIAEVQEILRPHAETEAHCSNCFMVAIEKCDEDALL